MAVLASCLGFASGTADSKPAAGSVEQVEFWVYQLEPHPTAWRPVVESFNTANPGLNVRMQAFPEYADKLSAAFAAKTAPDIIMGDPTAFSSFNKNRLVMPIANTGVITDAEARKIFFGALLDAFSFEGKLYALPVVSDPGSFTILYNIGMFATAGVKAPPVYASWADWLQTARKLTQYSPTGEVKVAGVNMRSHHGWDNFLHAVEAFGGDYFDEKAGKFTVTDDVALKAIRLLHGPVLDTPKLDNPTLPRMREALLQGHSAMSCDAPIIINTAKIEYPNVRIGVSMYPPLPDGARPFALISRGWALGISGESKHAKAAARFLQYAFKDDVYLGFLQRYSGTPATMGAARNEYFVVGAGAMFKPLMDTAPGWKAMPYIGNNTRYKNTYWQISQQVSNGSLAPKDALAKLEKELNFIADETFR
jgi:ABC-type glycerol-3-phosphate transport system substrate-binding protein